MVKQWLIEGFCPNDRYHCLMPVDYESIEKNGVVLSYRKLKMGCRKAGSCQYEPECPFYQKAPDSLEKNVNWYEP